MTSLRCPTCGFIPSDPAVQACPHDGSRLSGGHTVTLVSNISADLAAADTLVGSMVGEYQIVERLGMGGMGLVYRAVQPLIGKSVAIKVLKPEVAADPQQMERLLTEARAVSAVHHRNIVDIFGFGKLPDGRQYVLMEYLPGQTLDAVMMQRGPMPIAEALAILSDALAALGAAHEVAIVHRDFKPSNVLLVEQPGGSRYVKLLDFGLAKQGAVPKEAVPQTQNLVMGTPEYMAPEQARGEPVSQKTDIYSAGVVAYEMLTGQLPFQAPNAVEMLLKHLQHMPLPASHLRPELPADLDALILQMLEKAPEKRPSSAEAIRAELDRIVQDYQTASGTSPVVRRISVEEPRSLVEPALAAPEPGAAPSGKGRVRPAVRWAGLLAGALAAGAAVQWFVVRPLQAGHGAGTVPPSAAVPSVVTAPKPVPAPEPVSPSETIPAGLAGPQPGVAANPTVAGETAEVTQAGDAVASRSKAEPALSPAERPGPVEPQRVPARRPSPRPVPSKRELLGRISALRPRVDDLYAKVLDELSQELRDDKITSSEARKAASSRIDEVEKKYKR